MQKSPKYFNSKCVLRQLYRKSHQTGKITYKYLERKPVMCIFPWMGDGTELAAEHSFLQESSLEC